MIKKIVSIVFIYLFVFVFSGCWSKTEPKDMAIILSVVYDKDEGDNKIMHVEILNTSGQGSSAVESPVSTKLVKLYGTTLSESIRDNRITTDKILYAAHNKVRIFTERIAKSDIEDIMDFYLRDHLADETPFMFVLKNEDPMLVYKADRGLSNSLGVYIDSLSKAREEASEYSVFIDTLQFLQEYYSDGIQPVMGVINVVPDETYLTPEEKGDQYTPKYIMELNGLAVFKDKKMVGYLDKLETRAYNIVRDEIESATYISIPVEDKYVAANCHKTKRDIKTSFKKDMVTIDITIEKEIMIAENESQLDVLDKKQLKILEEACNTYIENEIKNCITRVQQEYSSDIFGFGEFFHIQNPEIWKTIKESWNDDYFAKAIIKVEVNSKAQFDGEIREKFGKKVEKSL